MGSSSEPIHAHRGFGSLLGAQIWSILRSAGLNAEVGGWVRLFIRSGILNMVAEGLGLISSSPPSFFHVYSNLFKAFERSFEGCLKTFKRSLKGFLQTF